MFKRLVKMIVAVNNMEDYSTACGEIDQMFNQGKISWSEHELLYDLIGKIRMA